VVGDCKEQQLSPAGSLFSCKAGDEGGTEAGYSGRKPIYPAALNRFNIFSILCFLVSHLQFCFGSWAVFRGSSLLAEMAGEAGSVLGVRLPMLCASQRVWRGRIAALAHRGKDGLSFPISASSFALLRSHGDAE